MNDEFFDNLEALKIVAKLDIKLSKQRELIDLAIKIFKAQEDDCRDGGYPWSRKTEKMIHEFFFKEGDLE